MESPNSSPFDPRLSPDWLQDVYGDDYAYALDMFEAFLNEAMPELYESVAQALEAGNATALRQAFHKFKAAPAMVGLRGLEDQLNTLELEALANNLTAVRADWQRFEQELAQWVPILEQQTDRLRGLL